MNKMILPNIVRIVLIFILQILVFKQINFPLGEVGTAQFLIYPLAIFMLPVKSSKTLLIIISFIMGIGLDLFYDSPGIHSATLVFTGYIRNIAIAFLEPYEGYNMDDVPTIRHFGLSWFFTYSSILLFIHIFTYFFLEAFSYVFFFEIFINTILSFFISLIIIVIYQFIFRPKL